MAKKYQVFVSSTYLDMKEERQAAVMAILDAGHIPAGMELFAAGDEAQWETIKKWIDESDVFMLLLGGRYGSIEPTSGLSYIEQEYDYAVTQGKPYFALVAEEEYLHGKKAKDKNIPVFDEAPELKSKLAAFKQKVLGKISASYASKDKITAEILKSLRIIERKNIPGWVRENEQPNISDITLQLSELMKTHNELKAQLSESKKNEKNSNSFDAIIKTLKRNMINKDKNQSLYDLFISWQNTLIQGVRNIKVYPNEFLWEEVIPQLVKYDLMERNNENGRQSSIVTQLGKDVLIYIDENEKLK